MATKDGNRHGREGRAADVTARPASARRTRWIGIAFVVLVVAAGAWTLTRGHSRATPVDAAAARREGIALYASGRYAEAVRSYELSLSVADDLATRSNLANALKKVGRFDEALEQYHVVLARNPRDATTWFDYGNLLRDHMHDVRGAVEAYRNAVEIDPRAADAHFSLGAALMDLKDYEAAIAEIQAALQLAPDDATWRKDAENALGLAHIRAAEKNGLPPPPHK